MKNLFLSCLIFVCFLLFDSGLNSVVADQPKPDKPNFVFIIADDCTHRDLGCYGGQAKTPNIDKLAEQGMRFAKCFQAAPMCSPTRHNIYTGLYPVKSGAYPNHTFAKDGTQSIVHYLKPHGYRVALSGKTHIAPRNIFEFEYSGKKNPDLDEVDKLFADCKESSTPFCLFACSNEPHSPWDKGDPSVYPEDKIKLPPYFVDTQQTRKDMSRYLAEITYFDWQVGEILKRLENHGLSDNTMVVVVSEQGSGLPFAKWTCYDIGLQSGCVIRWPGKVKPSQVSNAMIEYVDMVPTFLDAAGIERPDVLDGKSFVPVLRGETEKHKDFVFGIMTTRGIINGSDTYGIRSVRGKRFKYIRNLTPEIEFTNACTKSVLFKSWIKKAKTGDADAADKVKRYSWRPAEELYDLSADEFEWKNLADDPAFAEVKTELKQKLSSWMAEQGDTGQETELDALNHQHRNKKKKDKQKKEKKSK